MDSKEKELLIGQFHWKINETDDDNLALKNQCGIYNESAIFFSPKIIHLWTPPKVKVKVSTYISVSLAAGQTLFGLLCSRFGFSCLPSALGRHWYLLIGSVRQVKQVYGKQNILT